LADFFYVWLRQTVGDLYPDLFATELIEKTNEIVATPTANGPESVPKDAAFFETSMKAALADARRALAPAGIGTVVFAHKSTSGWEAILAALVDAGWVVTASWPIDTERQSRTNAQGAAALGSSVHLVCRPREDSQGSPAADEVGDWSRVLQELPVRIHDWMPRLAAEGVAGADAIFACLGPALEVFSRYSRVERADGSPVPLRDFLEHVWGAVSREALSMIFADPDTSGLEPDGRVTAIWLWTIASPSKRESAVDDSSEEATSPEEDEGDTSEASGGAFVLESDAARKIAQGLGARLEELRHVIEVKADKARLISVAERGNYLFGSVEHTPKNPKKTKKQRALFEDLEQAAEQQGWGDTNAPRAGGTTLDRVHQAMILFGAGRGDAVKRLLIEDGVGRSSQFWKLAQAFSALYPVGSNEKRWVDGVLARKKSLGF